MQHGGPQGIRWEGSQALLKRAARSLPHGVSSPFRASAPIPLYFEDGYGARLRDVDGNEYIDYALAWGPLILGHCHPRMVEAVSEAAAKPHAYGAQHRLEPEVCERIVEMVPCAERVALTSSGSEALQLAFRLARAQTGREKILRFEGHYHGWMDSALVSYKPKAEDLGPREAPHVVLGSRGQVANSVDNAVAACWNDLDALEATLARERGRIAAIVMEPVLCNSGCLPPREGYLQAVREICDREGALLIFDEVITGFRMGLGGAQGEFGVTPDIATFGKAIGGGLPLSAVAGRADLMELIRPGQVAFGGTFNGNPLSLAGAKACLETLSENDGAALQAANAAGRRLMERIRAAAERANTPLTITGFGTAFSLHFTSRTELSDYRDTLEDDTAFLARMLRHALSEGLHLLPDGRLYVSTAHTEPDIEETAAALERAMRAAAQDPA